MQPKSTNQHQSNFNPHGLNKTDSAKVRNPERFSLEPQLASEAVELTELEQTPGGYYNLEAEYGEIKKALRGDIRITLGSLSDSEIRVIAKKYIDDMNTARQQHSGVGQLDINGVDIGYLQQLIVAGWVEDGAKDGGEGNDFLKNHNPEAVPLIKDLHEVHAKLAVLSQNPELMQQVRETRAEIITVRHAVARYVAVDKRAQLLANQISTMYASVGMSGRLFTESEKRRIARLEEKRAESARAQTEILVQNPEIIDQIISEVKARLVLKDKHQLEKGLLRTGQTDAIINELMVAVSSGNPVLLVGETGGAKTAIAEYMCKHIMQKTPEFVSGYGDVNTYQLMGKMGLTTEGGVPVSSFTPGPVVRAMENGTPLILDEINAMPPEILKRLNKILQLRPGDKFVVQEDSGRKVIIAPGFCIFATANEKSKRYKGVEDFSAEFANRFGANIIRVNYPDSNVAMGQQPPDLMRLASVFMASETGKELVGISPGQLKSLVIAAHISQQLFTANYGPSEGAENIYAPTDTLIDDIAGLEETVIAPRTLIDILSKIKSAQGRLTLEQVLDTYLNGIKNVDDRKVMARIFDAHSLKQETPEGDMSA